MKQKPSIGRIVHVVHDGNHLPAIIGCLHSDICVSTTMFNCFGAPAENKTSVVYDDSPTPAENTWHWPERVD